MIEAHSCNLAKMIVRLTEGDGEYDTPEHVIKESIEGYFRDKLCIIICPEYIQEESKDPDEDWKPLPIKDCEEIVRRISGHRKIMEIGLSYDFIHGEIEEYRQEKKKKEEEKRKARLKEAIDSQSLEGGRLECQNAQIF